MTTNNSCVRFETPSGFSTTTKRQRAHQRGQLYHRIIGTPTLRRNRRFRRTLHAIERHPHDWRPNLGPIAVPSVWAQRPDRRAARILATAPALPALWIRLVCEQPDAVGREITRALPSVWWRRRGILRDADVRRPRAMRGGPPPRARAALHGLRECGDRSPATTGLGHPHPMPARRTRGWGAATQLRARTLARGGTQTARLTLDPRGELP